MSSKMKLLSITLISLLGLLTPTVLLAQGLSDRIEARFSAGQSQILINLSAVRSGLNWPESSAAPEKPKARIWTLEPMLIELCLENKLYNGYRLTLSWEIIRRGVEPFLTHQLELKEAECLMLTVRAGERLSMHPQGGGHPGNVYVNWRMLR